MPKKPPQNAFYYYMKDLQEQYREGGRTPSMKEMAITAHPLYKNLDRQKKLQYELKAKQAKAQRSETNEGRISSDGIPIQQLEAEEAELEFNRKKMGTDVLNFVNDNIHQIADTPIYIITFNSLVATTDLVYLPNEVGIVKYTMNEGILDSYHKFINPGAIPSGYTADAKEHSEKTHNIPFLMYDFELASTDYTTIIKNMLKFVNAHQGNQIIFCREDHMEQTSACFDWFVREAEDNRFVDNVSFADLGLLVTELLRVAGYQIPTKTFVDDMLATNTFDYEPKTRCDYHDDLDNPYCAVGFSRKMCFIISDNVIKHYGIQLTYRHLPERITEEVVQKEEEKIKNSPHLINNLSNSQANKLCHYSSSEDEDDFITNQHPKSTKTKTSAGPTQQYVLPPLNDALFGHGSGIGRGRGRFY